MATISEAQKARLANLIADNIRKDFNVVHVSGNLMNTISVYQTETGWAVDIPAQVYDINYYKLWGAIIPKADASYAQEVDESGGYSGLHKDYIERSIYKSIQQWLLENGFEGRIT